MVRGWGSRTGRARARYGLPDPDSVESGIGHPRMLVSRRSDSCGACCLDVALALVLVVWLQLVGDRVFGDHAAAASALEELALLFKYLEAMVKTPTLPPHSDAPESP